MPEITFTSFSDASYSSEQGTPFVISVVTDSGASSIDPLVTSQLPPPPPPPTASGGFDNLNYYSTAYIYLDSKRSRVTTLTTKGMDDPGSGALRETILKVFNRKQSDIEESNVYFQVDQAELSSSFDTFKIRDHGEDTETDIFASNVINGKLHFSIPRMDDNTTVYTLKYKTTTNVVAAISDFTDAVNGDTKEIGENTVANTEIFAFTATTVEAEQITSGVTYTITSGNSGNHFVIDGNVLKTTSTPINYDAPTVSISLSIQGQSISGGATISKDFTVNVTDLNETPTLLTFTKISDTLLTDSDGKIGDIVITDEDTNTAYNSYTFVIFNKDTTNAHDTLQILNQTEVHIKEGSSLIVGDNEFTIKATGSDTVAGHTLSDNFVISVGQHDRPPSGTIPDSTIAEDSGPTTVTLSDHITDLDGNAITFTLGSTHNTDLLTVSLDGAALTYTLVAHAHGDTTITVSAEANGKSVDVAFQVSVTSVNDLPVYNDGISDIDISTGNAITPIDLSNYFSDADVGDSLTYSATSSVTGVATVSISGSTMTITEVSTGTSVINISVSDGTETVTHDMNVTFSTRLRGDMNNDGLVNITDLLFLMKYLNEETEQVDQAGQDSGFNAAANVNVDSNVDVADLIYIQNHLNQVSGYQIAGTSF